MRHTRLAAAAVSIALFGVSASTGIAGADTPAGVGTTKTATTALDFQLGDLVGLRLLTDNAQASIDSKVVSQAEAFSRLTPLDINLLGTHIVPVPPLEARSTGASKEAGLPATGGLAGVPAALGTGNLGAGLLSAVVDQNGAHSGLKLDLSNIKLAGGSLLDTGVLSNLTANAVHPDADGVRGVSVPTLKLLDIGALLKLLGIDPTKLPLDTVTGLLGNLGGKVQDVTKTVPTLLDGAAVKTLITTIQNAITGSNTQASALPAGSPVSTLTQPVQDSLTGLLSGVVPPAGLPATPITTAVTDLTALLVQLLQSVLHTLDGITLLKFNGLELGTNTKAASTPAGSDAGVIGKIGSVQVGNLPLIPGVDLGSLLSQVNSTLNGVLGGLGLGNLLQLGVLSQNKGVTQDAGYVKSDAGITGLVARLVPLGGLANIVGGLNGSANPVSGLLGGAAVDSPSANNMGALGGLVGGLTSVLTKGMQLKVGDLVAQSNFAPSVVAAPARPLPQGQLAFTGSNSGLLAAFGLTMLAVAASLFGWLRKSGSLIS